MIAAVYIVWSQSSLVPGAEEARVKVELEMSLFRFGFRRQATSSATTKSTQ